MNLISACLVYKELRHQNKDFFKEYYYKMDLSNQAERLKHLMHRYRKVRASGKTLAGGADTRSPGTATQQTTTAVPDDVGLPESGAVLVGADGSSQSATTLGKLPSWFMQ